MKFSTRLKPISYLKAHAAEVLQDVGERREPLVITQNGEAKVVVASVTEGDDKPLKYPHVFRASRLLVLNKIDLLPYVPFDVDRCIRYARQLNPDLEILQVSALRGDGMDAWRDWVLRQLTATA